MNKLVDAISLRFYTKCMGLRGPKPKGKVRLVWSSGFAYAIGLICSDGCLYKDGRHISLTSLDIEQLSNFNRALDMDVKISVKQGAGRRLCTHIQFSDVLFHQFLVSIGVTPTKSRTIGAVKIPKKYYFDFLRGSFDGDGCFYSYYDKRWKSSFMFYITFVSASKEHIEWLRNNNKLHVGVWGHISKDSKGSTYQLKYAKKESMEIYKKMYYNAEVICLERKKIKIEKALIINDLCPGGET